MKKGWKEIKLGEYCDVRDGTHDSPKYVQNGYPLVTSKNLKGSFIDYTNIKYITKDDYIKINERSKVDVGDILFAMIGTIGNATLVEEEPTFAIKNMALFKTNSMLQGRFLRYYFQNNTILDDMRYKAKGTTQPFVSLGYLRNLKIQVPTIIEQKEIVEYLDSSFAKIDKLKENAAKNLEEAKALFQSALKDALEPKEGWEEKTLKEVANYRRGSFPQPYGNSEWYDGEDSMPFVQVAELQEDSFALIMPTKKRISKLAQPLSVFVPEGIVLVSLQGSIGKVGITQNNCYVDRTVAIFQSYKLPVDSHFFAYQLKERFAIERLKARGTTIKTITKEEFANFTIMLPPLSEQQSIVSFLDSLNEKVNTLQQNYSRICDECDALKQAILRQVFE